MKRTLRVLAAAGFAIFACHAAQATDANIRTVDLTTPASANVSVAPSANPPILPAGVAELKFSEFFKRPVGPYGLEASATLLSLDGKRVRIAGYMVEEEAPTPGLFILAPFPVALSDIEDGPADDLPASVVFVHLQGDDARALARHQSAPLLIVGTLQVGNQVEANDRVSAVRLLLEAPAAGGATTQASTATGAVRK